MSRPTATGTVRTALAEAAKTFGQERRVELIQQPAQRPRRAESPADRPDLSLPNSSQYFQQSRRPALLSTHVTARALSIDGTTKPRRISCPGSLLCETWQSMRWQRRNASSRRNSTRATSRNRSAAVRCGNRGRTPRRRMPTWLPTRRAEHSVPSVATPADRAAAKTGDRRVLPRS